MMGRATVVRHIDEHDDCTDHGGRAEAADEQQANKNLCTSNDTALPMRSSP